jgi:hypothetical protein
MKRNRHVCRSLFSRLDLCGVSALLSGAGVSALSLLSIEPDQDSLIISISTRAVSMFRPIAAIITHTG